LLEELEAVGASQSQPPSGDKWQELVGRIGGLLRARSFGRQAVALGHELRTLNPREHSFLSGRQVDDTPFGGGAGMVLRVDVMEEALRARYGVDLWEEFGAELQPFREFGWLIYDGCRLRLTRAGMLLAHEIMGVFLRPAAGPSA